MGKKPYLAGIGASLGMLLLILDSRCAIQSGIRATELCLRTVVPSLFPFLFLSATMTEALSNCTGPLLRIPAGLLNLPRGTERFWVSALLGGYPAGAVAVGNAFRADHLQKPDGEKLLAFCSNAGPAFLFGMVGFQFPEKWMVWCLWGIHLLSAGMVGAVMSCRPVSLPHARENSLAVTEQLRRSVHAMALICGWILLFRVLLGFLDRWVLWILPESIRVLVWGLLELSNGCCALDQIASVSVRFRVASAILSFGGVCVALQTASVCPGLNLKWYLRGKLLQTLFSLVLSAAVMGGWGHGAVIVGAAVLIVPKLGKNKGSIPAHSGV